MGAIGEEYYIYGAGIYGKAIVDSVIKSDKSERLLGIIERDPQSNFYRGVPIYKLADFSGPFEPAIVISILGYPGVEESLYEKGFNTVIPTHEVFDLFPNSLQALNTDGVLWRKSPQQCQWDDEAVSKLMPLFSDEKSRIVFDGLIAFRKRPCANTYPWPDTHEMYFPPELAQLYDYESLQILDIGAFDGDSLASFYERWPEKISNYVGIEVSPDNIKNLEHRLAQLDLENALVIQGAVGVPEGQSLVLQGNSSGTSVCVVDKDSIKTTDTLIEVIDLKKLCREYQFNIIKMDIEGADFKALQELAPVIKNTLPTLALSVYHDPADIWRMPLLINEIAPGKYDFFMRQEGHWGLETIFYAVPKVKP
ncbi:FkbM family methyltransferase [Pseudoalteromonas sp. T1lg65]|uniref:FkbM family methyltransferase n=1 Tax=Pseudoalteromonas sp. T1lg65 TaxID=2077101 RepID=UPI003F7AD0C5